MRMNLSFRLNTFVQSVALMALLGGCSPRAAADYHRIAAAEHDLIPPLYRGPLTVEGRRGGTLEVMRSEGGNRRIDRSYSSGASHLIALPAEGVVFHWTDFERQKNFLQTTKMAPEMRAVLQRWIGRERAQLLGPCAGAGENGSLYRFTRGPNLKGPGGNFIQACITPDGIVLTEALGSAVLGAGSDPTKAATEVTFYATSVRRDPVAADTFKVPAGLRDPHAD
jgi:hypothetical protein